MALPTLPPLAARIKEMQDQTIARSSQGTERPSDAQLASERATKQMNAAETQATVERAAGIRTNVKGGSISTPENTAAPKAPNFAETATNMLKAGAENAKQNLLGAPDSYDQQIVNQEAALWAKLGAKDLTPDDMRWLTPAQSNAILSGDDKLIRNQIASLNTIKTGRKTLKDEEQKIKDKEDAKKATQAATTFEVYSSNGLWDKLDPAARADMETTLGLPAGTIDALASVQDTDLYDYKYSAGIGNSMVELVTDKKTGKLVSTRTVGSTSTGTGSGGGGGAGGGGLASLSDRAKGVYENPALLANYTPTEKGEIQDEIINAGLDTSRLTLNKVTGVQREKIAEFDGIMRQADYADEALFAGLSTGVLDTRIKQFGQLFGGSSEFTKYDSAVSNMNSLLIKARSGQAVTPQEFSRIKGFIPLITDDETTASTKMTQFRTEMEAARENFIIRSTQSSFELQQSVLGGIDLQVDSTLLQDLDFKL